MRPPFKTPHTPLLKTLAPCPDCGRTVLMRLWNKGDWIELPNVQNPVTGKKHVCATAPGMADTTEAF
jgi:hypothetical protein